MVLLPVSRILFVKNLKYVSRKLNTYALQPTESISNPQVAIVWEDIQANHGVLYQLQRYCRAIVRSFRQVWAHPVSQNIFGHTTIVLPS